jgi:hypothetical protein
MSILSTNKKLIRIGDDYSAGSGIDITDRVISVTSFGPEYSAGPNIDIQDYVISGRDWSEEINAVSANANSAFNEWLSNDYTIDQTNITNKFTFVSGEVDNKLDKADSAMFYPMEGNPSGFLTQHQDLTYLSGKVDEKLDATAFSTVSGDFLTAIPDEYATKDFVSNSITGKLDISSFSSVSGDFLTNEDLNGYATESFVQDTSANITALIPTDYYPDNNPSGFITGVDLSNYYTKTDTSSKEELTNAFNNVNVPSSVLDLSGFEYNEQNLISGYGGSAFAGQGGGAEYTGIAPIVVDNENDTIGLDTFILSGGQNVDLVEDYENNIVRIDIDLSGMSFDDYYKKTETSSREELNTAIQYVSANAGKTYTGISPIVVNNTTNEISADAWVLSGGNGISLVDDNINNITRIDVTAQGGDPEVQNLVRSNSSTWDSVTNKLDTTAFSDVSGTFLTAHQSLDDYATKTLVEETSGSITSLIPTNYYPDTNPSGFITGVDLTPYQTIEGMTAYQPAGSYATTAEVESISSMLSGAIDYVSANAGDEFPDSADEAIQYVQTNSANIDDTVTSYQTNSGDYLKESELGYNAVDEVSAINGSAIAQYGAEKQWLVHDDTLVHASNSAQYALGVNLSAVAQLLGVDETVLFENWESPIRSTTATGSLAEPLTSFDSFEVTWAPYGNRGEARWEPVIQKFPSYPSNSACYYPLFAPWLVEGDAGTYLFMELLSANDTNFCIKEGRFYQYTTTVTGKTTDMSNTKIYKIVGIGRKS